MRLFVLAGLLAGSLVSVAAAQQNPAMNPGGSLAPPPKFLGRDLQVLCDSAEGSARLTGCLRYLQASVAMYELIVADGKEITWFCTPREAPAALLRQQFVEWAKENGDQLGLDAIQTVRQAMTDAFPCQE